MPVIVIVLQRSSEWIKNKMDILEFHIFPASSTIISSLFCPHFDAHTTYLRTSTYFSANVESTEKITPSATGFNGQIYQMWQITKMTDQFTKWTWMACVATIRTPGIFFKFTYWISIQFWSWIQYNDNINNTIEIIIVIIVIIIITDNVRYGLYTAHYIEHRIHCLNVNGVRCLLAAT